MARRFEFATVAETLEIAGYQFRVDCNSDKVLAAVTKFGDRCIEISKLGDKAAAEKGIPVMEEMLDTVLGTGACDMIFAVRGKNFNDIYDVSLFVCESIEAARNEHSASDIRKQTPQQPQNRVQRRSHGKGRRRRAAR